MNLTTQHQPVKLLGHKVEKLDSKRTLRALTAWLGKHGDVEVRLSSRESRARRAAAVLQLGACPPDTAAALRREYAVELARFAKTKSV